MQVIVELQNSDRPRQHFWVSAQGDYDKVVDGLLRSARRDLNLSPAEDVEFETVVRLWTPSGNNPLPVDEDRVHNIRGDNFTLRITCRSEERVAMVARDVDQLLGIGR